MCLQPVLSTALLPLPPAGPRPSVLGDLGATQCPLGAAQTSSGRGAPALLEHCPCTIACTALSSPSHKRRLLLSCSSLIHITSWGKAAHPRDATAVVGAELLQTLTFPTPWESEIRPASWEESAAQHKPSDCFVQSKKKQTFYFLINILQPPNTPSNYSFYMSLSLMTS